AERAALVEERKHVGRPVGADGGIDRRGQSAGGGAAGVVAGAADAQAAHRAEANGFLETAEQGAAREQDEDGCASNHGESPDLSRPAHAVDVPTSGLTAEPFR